MVYCQHLGKQRGQAELNVHIRFFKKGAEIVTAVYKEQRLESREDIGFAPVGLDEPYRIVAMANPLRFTDPKGLAVVYDCYRPLDHGLWFVQYHRYLLIDGAGWGLTTADGGMGLTSTPGKLEPDNATSGWGIHCVPVQVSDCRKQCLKTEIEKDQKNPPNYNIYTFNCQAWVSNIFSRCPNK